MLIVEPIEIASELYFRMLVQIKDSIEWIVFQEPVKLVGQLFFTVVFSTHLNCSLDFLKMIENLLYLVYA